MNWRLASDAIWIVLAIVAAALVVAGRHTASVTRPGTALRRLLQRTPARVAVLVFWMWLGWHSFAR